MCQMEYHLIGEVGLRGAAWPVSSHGHLYLDALNALIGQVPVDEGGQLLYVGYDWPQNSCPLRSLLASG